jgi:hypothetical protein
LGSSLNEHVHVHVHVCVVDGVFEAVVGEASEQGTRTTATSVMSPVDRLRWIGCAKRVASWSTYAPSSTASPAVSSETSAVQKAKQAMN